MMADEGELNLAPSEKDALAKLREKLEDIIKPEHDDHFLVKWLTVRSFDVDKTEAALRKHKEWREKYGADGILEDWTPPEVLQKYWPGGLAGYTKDGLPVWLTVGGENLDIKGLTMSAKRSDILKFTVWRGENMKKILAEQSKKLGKRVDKVVLIDDIETVAFKQLFRPGMDVMAQIIHMTELNNPDGLERSYIVNAPTVFPMLLKIVKPFVSERTTSKITILGADWKEKLREVMDVETLPHHWGGKATGPGGDPYCKDRICVGGPVPVSYYLKGQNLVAPEKVQKTKVDSGSTFELTFDVFEEGYWLKWIFWTAKNDIKFGITCQAGPTVDEVLPVKKFKSHLIPDDGAIECKDTGIYTVQFDNSYSWMQSKELSYCIELVAPDKPSEKPKTADTVKLVTPETHE